MKLLQGGKYGYLSFLEWEEFEVLKFKLHFPYAPAKQTNQLQWNLLNLLAFSNNFWEEEAYYSHN